MLRALLRNKLGRSLPDGGADEDTVSIRDFVRRSEDALTATVFERLLFLPPSRAASVVDDVLEGDARVFGSGYPELHFWPSHEVDGGRVEPDVVLVHADRIVVVEVKWGTDHYVEQWRRELRAADAYYPDDRELHLVLIGRERERAAVLEGLAAFRNDALLSRRLATGWLSWERVFARLGRAFDEIPPWEQAVLVDLRDALSDRGLRVRLSLDSLVPVSGLTSAEDMLGAWPLKPDLQSSVTPDRTVHPLPSIKLQTTATDLLTAWRL